LGLIFLYRFSGDAMTAAVSSALGVSDSTLRVFLRALWIARVPVFSIVAAFLIFTQAEALDLFVDMPPNQLQRIFHWFLFYVAAILFWVLPANFSARVALQLNHERIGIDTPRRYLAFVIALPRVLSVLCLLVIAYAFLQAWSHVPAVMGGTLGEQVSSAKGPLADQARWHLMWAAVWAVVLSIVCMGAFAWLSRLAVLERSKLRPISPFLYDRLDNVVHWCKPRRRRVIQPVFEEPLASTQHNTLISVLLLLTIIFVIDIILSVLFLSPKLSEYMPSLESYLPRAVFVPVLLGIYVPFLALLGILSHRYRAPLILIFLLSLGIWGLFREERHVVRPAPPGPVQRISLAEAVDLWKAANGCERTPCPQPIIVAGSGGASRAAFMTANAMGLLQEKFPDFRKRLFAMSTVSGSSLGAAAFLAGLEYGDAPDTHTCKDKRFEGWFGCHDVGESAENLAKSPLRKRLQLFLSQDFLTPVAVTFTFSDMWRVWENRAVRLEKSWEKAWREVTNDKTAGDFSKRLSRYVPQPNQNWRPLLIFNGTSVWSGRRIIVSSLSPTHNRKRLFTDAFDYYEMACPALDGKDHDCDLRLSTAVTMSARFPIVSPAGVIVQKGVPIDRVVDGGYFENFGAQTALELARALEKLKLEPFILQVTNDPSAFEYGRCKEKIPWEDEYHRREPVPPSEFDEANLLRWAFDPLGTVLATRTARGTHATAEALRTVTPQRYAQIRVCPERISADSSLGLMAAAKRHVRKLLERVGIVREPPQRKGKSEDAFKSLSASWWLSAPVQQYLHEQLKAPHNEEEIKHVGEAINRL
jgi:hypothetical protein